MIQKERFNINLQESSLRNFIKLSYNKNKNKDNDLDLEYIIRTFSNLGNTEIIVNRLDYYANSIPLGAFCNAISFIIYGFHRCYLFTNDTFLWGVILLFGGLGQITSGILEFLKCRVYPAILYFLYGLYCLSHYTIYIIPFKFKNYEIYGIDYEYKSLAFFYGACFIISIPLVFGSLNINVFYLLQTFFTMLFFFIRWVGELKEDNPSIKYTIAGICEVIAGFISLYICINQIINEQFKRQFLPSFPLSIENEIDIIDNFQKLDS